MVLGVRTTENCTNRTFLMGYVILFSHVGILFATICGSCFACFGKCLGTKWCSCLGYSLSGSYVMYVFAKREPA